MRGLLLVLACAACIPAFADEGLWTFDNFPAQQVKQTYGVEVSPAWLDHVRLSTLRLSNCSASFVSSRGLILTNQHCIEPCLAAQSTPDQNFVESGFSAHSRKEEQRCLSQQADVLIGSEDITDQVLKATAGMSETAANAARKRLLGSLEEACERSGLLARIGRLKCQTVKLYQGGQFFLYKYKRYDDVRLVFAPESDIASFGGDVDNFEFPRSSLDFALLRAYENDRPAKTPNFLRIDFAGPQDGVPVFFAGNPSSTACQPTRAQLEFERDTTLPVTLLRASELRARYLQFAQDSPVHARIVRGQLDMLGNIIKGKRQELAALNDPAFWSYQAAQEKDLQQASDAAGLSPWAVIDAAMARDRTLYLPFSLIESGTGFSTLLFREARWLVRGTMERDKPNDERLREFTDNAMPVIERTLFARVPVYTDYEQLNFSYSLERMREALGPNYPLVRKLFAQQSPQVLAAQLITETQLDDAALRRRLWESGRSAVAASRDPMIQLARAIDPDARALRQQYENEVEAPVAGAAASIAALRFKLYGRQIYPDATFTLRLNVGLVQGWQEGGSDIPSVTHLERAFERGAAEPAFKIPDAWLRAKDQLDMHTPFCIATNNDIVGGSSGSPLLDVSGRLVGLIFDGNSHSLAGRYWFNAANNRAVALHPAIIREALEKVYHADFLVSEMTRGS
jgi:nicotinamide mononucleotide adenylyltransferase